MAPIPSEKSNLSTPSAKIVSAQNQSRTPQSKNRLNFTKETAATEHPVEVIGRIRDYPNQKNRHQSNHLALQLNADGKSMRVKTETGYRDFTLDGVSLSEEQDLDAFYRNFVESRINGVKVGQKCTIMMYGPTGSGKSHTMFGCSKQPGIVYNSLKGILGQVMGEDEDKLGLGTFVQVTVLEIYNEEIYDLLSSTSNTGGFSFGWPKNGSASKVRLEVMGKKAKNATFISGNEAGKILKEIQNVEKRRIVKSTLCNERSSRSHCMIIVDVPTVGGRLMLIDMAGSENIEQAGQSGLEAKMQTAKINQGNIALKRVVESIANGDSHVPFRDSKLTMLLQDSFEDDKSKILMVLCASPDPKELHKTIATLEYGAKAKCIVRGPYTPVKDRGAEYSSSAVILGSRITALDQFICKLQMENKHREKEQSEAQKALQKREEEVSMLRAKLAAVEGRGVETSEKEIDSKVHQRTLILKGELERMIQECQRMANGFLEMEMRKMEELVFQQQQEVEMLRRRLEDIESELRLSRATSGSVEAEDGTTFMRRLLEACSEDSDMVKSMDLSKSIDMETNVIYKSQIHGNTALSGHQYMKNDGIHCLPIKNCLMTVYEEEEYENEEDKENLIDEEVQKEVIEEKKMIVTPEMSTQCPEKPEDSVHTASSRQLRIQNIFTLCGNYRELSQNNVDSTHDPTNTGTDDSASKLMDESSQLQQSISEYLLVSSTPKTDQNIGEQEFGKLSSYTEITEDVKYSPKLLDQCSDCDGISVYVKWEASKENPGKLLSALKVSKDSTLADLRKLIEIHLGGDQQAFTFLVLGDASGSPVPKDKEAITLVSKLPVCSDQIHGYLACLRRANPLRPTHLPFSPLENKPATTTPTSNFTKKSRESFSPELPGVLGFYTFHYPQKTLGIRAIHIL